MKGKPTNAKAFRFGFPQGGNREMDGDGVTGSNGFTCQRVH